MINAMTQADSVGDALWDTFMEGFAPYTQGNPIIANAFNLLTEGKNANGKQIIYEDDPFLTKLYDGGWEFGKNTFGSNTPIRALRSLYDINDEYTNPTGELVHHTKFGGGENDLSDMLQAILGVRQNKIDFSKAMPMALSQSRGRIDDIKKIRFKQNDAKDNLEKINRLASAEYKETIIPLVKGYMRRVEKGDITMNDAVDEIKGKLRISGNDVFDIMEKGTPPTYGYDEEGKLQTYYEE